MYHHVQELYVGSHKCALLCILDFAKLKKKPEKELLNHIGSSMSHQQGLDFVALLALKILR